MKTGAEISRLMTGEEAARLYRLEDIGVCLWGYWGVERTGQPRLASRLVREVLRFSASGPSQVSSASLFHRDIGRGRIMLSLPSLRVAGKDTAMITESDEGPVLVAVEGEDIETWEYGVFLYRLVRRLYPARGKGGKPGQISWKVVASWLMEEPGLLDQFIEFLVERKIRRWEKERNGEGILTSEREWVRHEAYLEIKRGLARCGLKVSDFRKNEGQGKEH